VGLLAIVSKGGMKVEERLGFRRDNYDMVEGVIEMGP